MASLAGIRVHSKPDWEFGDGSYFDPPSGNFVIHVNTSDSSGSFGNTNGKPATFGLYLHIDGINPDTNTAFATEIAMGDRGGAKYTNFSRSGKINYPAGSKTAYIVMHCDFVDQGTMANDCGADACISDIWTLISPPKISDLTNANKYNNADYISASENSISVNFKNASTTDTATIIAWMIEGHTGWNSYTLPEGQHIGPGGWKTFKIPWTGFQPGTSYKIYVNLENSAGPGTSPSFLTITIRTLHSRPVLSISHDHLTQSGLEDVTISWESDKNVQKISYTIDGSVWIVYEEGLDLKSGTVTIDKKDEEDLYDNTEYEIQLSVQTTDKYDNRWDVANPGPYQTVQCTTDERALLEDSSPRNLITGERLRIQKQNESGNNNQIRLFVSETDIEWKTEASPLNTDDYYISITQDEWDAVYRQFISPADFTKTTEEHNKIPLKIHVVTFGREREYINEYTGWLILNGNMLTAHVNINGEVKRGKVFAKHNTGIKRGVTWISTATGHWRRGI